MPEAPKVHPWRRLAYFIAGWGAIVAALLAFRAPIGLTIAFLLIFGVLTAVIVGGLLEGAWSFEHAMEGTRSLEAARRRAAAGELCAAFEKLSDEQVNVAAIRMGELADDADAEVRWQAGKGLAIFAPRLGGTTRTALFSRAVKLSADADARARGASAVAIALLVGGPAGVPPSLSRSPIEKLLDDPEGMVRLWALDAVAAVAPLLEGRDRAELTFRVLRSVTFPEASTAWKAGRTIVVATANAAPELAAQVVDELLTAAAREGGEGAVLMIDLAAELKPRLLPPDASNSVARLVAMAEPDSGELGLRALRAAAIFATHARIDVGDPTTQGLARMGIGKDTRKRDGALLCLGAIGAWAGPFGVEVQAGGAYDVAKNLIEEFRSSEPMARRWARDLWPVAYRAVAADKRDALLRLLLEAHADPVKNTRAAASATITAIRPDLTGPQRIFLADGLVALLKHQDGDTKRHATVTLVELYEVLDEPRRAEVLGALAALTADPDPIVADQARDSVRAVDEFRRKQAAALRAT